MSPEAAEILDELLPEYPLAFALTGLGVIIVLVIEQIVLMLASSRRKYSSTKPSSKYSGNTDKNLISPVFRPDSDEHNEDCGFVSCEHTKQEDIESKILNHDHDHDHDHGHQHDHGHSGPCSSSCAHEPESPPSRFRSDSHSHEHHSHPGSAKLIVGEDTHDHELLALDDLAKADTMQDLVLAYALEMSTAIHSIIIGVNLGLLGDGEYNTISILLVALCFHQFVEGLGLGNVIENNKLSLGWNKIIVFIVVFSLTVSLGVLIGILTSASQSTESEEGAKGAATAVASGSLLYTSLVEMVGKYFGHSHHLEGHPYQRMAMLSSFVFGFSIMALIGVWA